MGTATVLHLLSAVPEADPPDPSTIISATTPTGGILTTTLMDPAAPAAGYTQATYEVKPAASSIVGTYNFVFGRFITKPLPAQTIGAGTWNISLAFRFTVSGTATSTIQAGFALAQWRSGTGVVTRLVDAHTLGSTYTPSATQDLRVNTSSAGSSATLLANDCLVLEIWLQWVVSANTGTPDFLFLFNGLGQQTTGLYAASQLTDTDGVLTAPAAITFG